MAERAKRLDELDPVRRQRAGGIAAHRQEADARDPHRSLRAGDGGRRDDPDQRDHDSAEGPHQQV